MRIPDDVEARMEALKAALEARENNRSLSGIHTTQKAVEEALNALLSPVYEEGYGNGWSDGTYGGSSSFAENPYEGKVWNG